MTLSASVSESRKTIVGFALLALVWGSSFVAIEIGLHAIPPLSFAGIRYLAAGGVLLGVAYATTDRPRPRTRAEWLSVGVVATFVVAAYHGFLYLGELRTSGPLAAVVVSLSPVLTAPLASALLPNQRIGTVEVLGLLLGVGGVAIVANPSGVANVDPFGVALVFLGALSFALGSVLTRPLDAGLPLRTTQAWAMVLGSVVLLAVGAVRGETLVGVEWTTAAVGSLVYLTLVAGVGGYLLYFTLLSRAGPMQVNLVGYAEPMVATLVGYVLLGHAIQESTVVGFAAILLGFAVLQRRALLSVARATTRVAAQYA